MEQRFMGVLIVIIVVLLLLGVFFKVLKLAIMLALAVGAFVVIKNVVDGKRLK